MPVSLAAAVAREVPPATAIPAEAVRLGDRAAQDVLEKVRPTEASQGQRADVVEHVRRMLSSSLGCEVFSFGSVPLKTYLPDGDIDMTVLGNTSQGSSLVNDVRCLLESEENNADAVFQVKDIHYIQAEVQLIKCLIQNIVVDISFNQIGGLCTLCFLELVDCHIGKNHLFKRSIILIKAWCYYESRILGAQHGLLSTYALETLVLYVFNLFHKHLDCPLVVLYWFLEYFSKFDWDNYCITLNGPAVLSSFPDCAVEMQGIHGDELLFNREFLNGSVRNFLDTMVDPRRGTVRFSKKFMNIIDPLRENNNLGRSVSKSNLRRMQSAFSFAARRLGQILMLPPEIITDGIYKFFKHTLLQNDRGPRRDVINLSFDDENSLLTACLFRLPFQPYSNFETSGSPNELEKTLYYPAKDLNGKDLSVSTIGHCNYLEIDQVRYCRRGVSDGSEINYCQVTLPWFNNRHCSTEFRMNHDAGHNVPMISRVKHGVCCRPATEPYQETRPGPVSVHHTSASVIVDPSNQRFLNSCSSWTTQEIHETESVVCNSLNDHLLDLSGDLDSHLKSLRQVQYHLEYMFSDIYRPANVIPPSVEVEDDQNYMESLIQTMMPANEPVGSPICESSPALYSEANATNSTIISYHNIECVPKFSPSDNHRHSNGIKHVWLPVAADEQHAGQSSPAASWSNAGVEKLHALSHWHGSQLKRSSRGTGTFFPKVHFYKYREHIAYETATKESQRNHTSKNESKTHLLDDSNMPEASQEHAHQNQEKSPSMLNPQTDGLQGNGSSEDSLHKSFSEQNSVGESIHHNDDAKKNLLGALAQTFDGGSTHEHSSNEKQDQTFLVSMSQHEHRTTEGFSSSHLESCQLHKSPVQSYRIIEHGSLGLVGLGASVSLPCSEGTPVATSPKIPGLWACAAEKRAPNSYLLKDEADFPPLRGEGR